MSALRKKLIKTPAAAADVPQNRDEVSDAIARIGVHQRERVRLQAAMNDEIAAIKAGYEAQAEPHNAAIKGLSAGVETWCAANRMKITDGGKVKTAAFAAGEVRWRVTPPKVVIKGVDLVMNALRRAGLTDFIRYKEEISKEAILAAPEAVAGVPGITISQVEEFVVVPFETTLEEVV